MTQPFAMIFPGQGSQSVGMLSDFGDVAIVKQAFTQASEVLGYDLWELTQAGPEDKLNQTALTQPAILTGSVALWHLWQDNHGPIPHRMAGHSLGEYSALVCADALSFEQAVALVAKRGQFMQEAVPEGEGAMAAIIGLANGEVLALCEAQGNGDVLTAANFNAYGQVVVAGHRGAVERAMAAAKSAGAKLAALLPVSVPSHCLLMAPASDRLAMMLADVTLHTPSVPVLQNVEGKSYEDPILIKEALVKQLHSPVLWVQTIEGLAADGCETLVECGPGKVLTGLTKRIDKALGGLVLTSPEALTEAVKTLGGKS